MRRPKVVLAAVSSASLLGAGLVAGQIRRTVRRPDLPSFPNQDISGTFGDPSRLLLRVVAVGDSSLTAPGIDDLDDVWLRRIVRSYTDRHRVELISVGVGGARARDVLDGQLAAAAGLRADVAVVSVGGNDVIWAVPVRRYARELEHIVGRLEAASGAVVLVGVGDLGAIPRLPSSLRPYLSWRSALFDRACARVAAAHLRTAKTDARRQAGPTFQDDAALFAADQFHASAAGHALFAEVVTPAFERAYRIARNESGAAATG